MPNVLDLQTLATDDMGDRNDGGGGVSTCSNYKCSIWQADGFEQ